jgi:hypothetical protein
MIRGLSDQVQSVWGTKWPWDKVKGGQSDRGQSERDKVNRGTKWSWTKCRVTITLCPQLYPHLAGVWDTRLKLSQRCVWHIESPLVSVKYVVHHTVPTAGGLGRCLRYMTTAKSKVCVTYWVTPCECQICRSSHYANSWWPWQVFEIHD